MKTIKLEEIDRVYARMRNTMNHATRINYCMSVIDLTSSFLGTGGRRLNRRVVVDTLAAAQYELHFLRNGSRF